MVTGIAIFGIEPVAAIMVLVGAGLGLLWNFKSRKNGENFI